MPARLSKEVTDRVRACLFVLSAFVTRGPEVAAAVQEITRPHLADGDAEPGFAADFVALHRTLKAAMDRMVAADMKLYAALAWEATLRALRVRKVKDLAFCLVGLRRGVVGHYLDPDLAGLGLQPVTARDTTTILRRVDLLDERFGEDEDVVDRMLGPARFDDPLDVRKRVRQMKATADEVRGLVAQISEAKRQIAAARSHKHAMTDAYDQIFLRSARIFEDYCRYAGRDDLADSVRASKRRPGRTVKEPEEVDVPVGDVLGGVLGP